MRSRKFYALLPHRLDRAEADWHDVQPENQVQPELIEHEPERSEAQRLLGGAMQLRYKFFKKNDTV